MQLSEIELKLNNWDKERRYFNLYSEGLDTLGGEHTIFILSYVMFLLQRIFHYCVLSNWNHGGIGYDQIFFVKMITYHCC